MLCTGPFRIDLADERLWRGSEAIALRPKTWAVLRQLVERPGRLVSKRELLDAVWGGVAIEEKVLNASIAEIRTALGDDARSPRYVATVPRRGFRFIAPLSDADHVPAAPRAPAARRTPFVGRESEVAQLAAAYRALRAGEGGVVLVSGPAGIGKSRLVAEVLAREDAAAGSSILSGRCLEGGAIAFWPWVEAMRAALRGGAAERARARCGAATLELARIVPELGPADAGSAPAAAGDAELARLRLFDAIALFFERATDEPPVLVLEDLHWAEADSLRALQAVALRLVERPALVLATLRDDEIDPARSRARCSRPSRGTRPRTGAGSARCPTRRRARSSPRPRPSQCRRRSRGRSSPPRRATRSSSRRSSGTSTSSRSCSATAAGAAGS